MTHCFCKRWNQFYCRKELHLRATAQGAQSLSCCGKWRFWINFIIFYYLLYFCQSCDRENDGITPDTNENCIQALQNARPNCALLAAFWEMLTQPFFVSPITGFEDAENDETRLNSIRDHSYALRRLWENADASLELSCVQTCYTIQDIFSLTILAGISIFRAHFGEFWGNDPKTKFLIILIPKGTSLRKSV